MRVVVAQALGLDEVGNDDGRRARVAVVAVHEHAHATGTGSVGEAHGGGVAVTFFRSLKTFRLTFLRMPNRCKISPRAVR